MDSKTTVLMALLVPGLLSLAACNRTDTTADPAATPPAASPMATDMPPPPMDTMPADGSAMTGDDLSFAQMDRNNDGFITQDELSPTDMLYQHFSVADTDGDGRLSEAEVAQHRADMAADRPR